MSTTQLYLNSQFYGNDDHSLRFLNEIISSRSSGFIFSQAFSLVKSNKPQISLGYLCTKAHIGSKGYLSEVLGSKKIINNRYVRDLAKALGFQSTLCDFVQYVVILENLGKKNKTNPLEHIAIKEKIQKLKEVINQKINAEQHHSSSMEVLFYINLLSVFALFKGQPTRKQLTQYFHKIPRLNISASLNRLKKMGVITYQNDFYQLKNNALLFSNKEFGFSYLEYLKKSLSVASNELEKWHNRPNEAHYTASIISVNKKNFTKKISTLDSEILILQNDLESADADMLVQFNVQVFPIDLSNGSQADSTI